MRFFKPFFILVLPIFIFGQADTVSYDRVIIIPGSTVPNFSASDEIGTTHQLSDLKGKKNLVLIFYRGYW
ncbi:MAG: hypothetical protein U9N31_01565 [Candidatus Marinimicrobia bacterium]|nr:hypothetical protein [Candidatus Neomarinimicrobiota bacterium]